MAELRAAAATPSTRMFVEQALARFAVRYTDTINSYADHRYGEIFISKAATPADVLGIFAHEFDHLTAPARIALTNTWNNADYSGYVAAKIESEASAMARHVTLLHLNGTPVGPQGFGYSVTPSEVAQIWQHVVQTYPDATPEEFHTALTRELSTTLRSKTQEILELESKAARDFLNTYRDGRLEREAVIATSQENSSQAANSILVSYTTSYSAALSSLPDFQALEVHQVDGTLILVGTTAEGDQWAAEVNADAAEEESGSFSGTFPGLPLEALIPGWYLNVQMSAPGFSIEAVAGTANFVAPPSNLSLPPPRASLMGDHVDALIAVAATFSIAAPFTSSFAESKLPQPMI